MYILDIPCGSLTILKVVYFIKIILQIVFIVVPVGLIVIMMIDLVKAVTAKDENDQKKIIALTVKRVLFAVALFFVPTIVALFMNMLDYLGATDYKVCYDNATSTKIEEVESTIVSTDIDLKLTSDYTKVYFTWDSNNCPTYFTYSDNVKNNKSGCEVNVTKVDENTYWYNATEKKYCVSSWTFTSSVSNLIENSSSNPGCVLKRKSSGGSYIVTPGGGNKYDATRTILIGDSRMVGICSSSNFDKSYECIAEIGMGFTWLRDTALPKAQNIINNSNETFNVLIAIGFNDMPYYPGITNQYINKYTQFAEDNSSHNIIITPVLALDESKSSFTTNEKIKSFNDDIKTKLENISNISYCNIYDKVPSSLTGSDGIHYTSSIYQQIYEYLTEECLE